MTGNLESRVGNLELKLPRLMLEVAQAENDAARALGLLNSIGVPTAGGGAAAGLTYFYLDNGMSVGAGSGLSLGTGSAYRCTVSGGTITVGSDTATIWNLLSSMEGPAVFSAMARGDGSYDTVNGPCYLAGGTAATAPAAGAQPQPNPANPS